MLLSAFLTFTRRCHLSLSCTSKSENKSLDITPLLSVSLSLQSVRSPQLSLSFLLCTSGHRRIRYSPSPLLAAPAQTVTVRSPVASVTISHCWSRSPPSRSSRDTTQRTRLSHLNSASLHLRESLRKTAVDQPRCRVEAVFIAVVTAANTEPVPPRCFRLPSLHSPSPSEIRFG